LELETNHECNVRGFITRAQLARATNFFRIAAADRICSSLPVRLDETLPQLVEFTSTEAASGR
jgi:hypothetical protein